MRDPSRVGSRVKEGVKDLARLVRARDLQLSAGTGVAVSMAAELRSGARVAGVALANVK